MGVGKQEFGCKSTTSDFYENAKYKIQNTKDKRQYNRNGKWKIFNIRDFCKRK